LDDGSNHQIVKIGDSNHLYVFACLPALVAVSVALFLTEDGSEQPDDLVLVRFPHLRRGLAQVFAAGRLIILFFVCFTICHLSGSPMRIFSWLASKFRWMRHKASFPIRAHFFSGRLRALSLERRFLYPALVIFSWRSCGEKLESLGRQKTSLWRSTETCGEALEKWRQELISKAGVKRPFSRRQGF